MQLVTSKNEISYRGSVPSTTMNEFVENVHYDLSQLMDAATRHELAIPENMNILLRENYFIASKLTSLETMLTNLINANNGIITHTFTSDNDIVSSSNVTVDTSYGIAHMSAQSSTSKVHLLDQSGRAMLPKSLSVKVYESEFPIDNLTSASLPFAYDQSGDKNLLRAFDGSRDTVWTREYMSQAADELYIAIRIELPSNIANHMRANSITIDPCPQYSMTLLDIMYQTTAGNWYRWSTYPTTTQGVSEVPTAITTVTNTRFVMPRKDVTAIVLYFSQPTWFAEGSNRIFMYGFREIGIDYVRFNDTVTGKIRMAVRDPLSRSLKYVDSISAIWSETGIDTGVTFNLYTTPDGQTPWGIGATNELPLGTKEVYVEASMKCDASGTTPLLGGVRITYVPLA